MTAAIYEMQLNEIKVQSIGTPVKIDLTTLVNWLARRICKPPGYSRSPSIVLCGTRWQSTDKEKSLREFSPWKLTTLRNILKKKTRNSHRRNHFRLKTQHSALKQKQKNKFVFQPIKSCKKKLNKHTDLFYFMEAYL